MNNREQFDLIYSEHKNLVYNLALNYLQNEFDAQDLTQEIFIKAYQNLHKHNPALSSVKTWLYRIAVNQCLDFLKAKKAKRRFGFIVNIFKPDTTELIQELSGFSHPGVSLENKEEIQQLFCLINKLPDKQKMAIILTKVEDRPQKEVADMMQISIKAVESLLQRAKHQLKKMGNKEGI